MKLSARNQLKGKIVGVTKGQTTAHVRIDIGGGVIVTSSITNEAIDDLALKVGDDAIAVIKASDVMVAKLGDASFLVLVPARSPDWPLRRRPPKQGLSPIPPIDGSASRTRCGGFFPPGRLPRSPSS